jgi:hypothetical protein
MLAKLAAVYAGSQRQGVEFSLICHICVRKNTKTRSAFS